MAEVELISLPPSPAEPPLLRTQKKVKEGEEAAAAANTAASGRNLRRKRIMDAVFTKPVTRRKKL